MKLSWGIKIALLYSGFVVLIVSMVTLAMRQKVDLVSKDYYEQELKFQNKIDMSNRTQALKEPLTWQVKQGALQFNFPSEFKGQKINGEVLFFRPSDASMDKTLSLNTDSVNYDLNTSTLSKGLYKMQVNWKVNNTEYYNEGIIQIN